MPESNLEDTGQADTFSHASSTSCRSIRHDSGETRICGQPQRLVALDPHGMDLLLSLGVQPVGYAEEARAQIGSAGIGEAMTQIQYLGYRITHPPAHVGSRTEPSLEAITRLKPDLIFGENFSQFSYPTLAKIAPTLFLSGRERNTWQRNLLILGQALQKESQAQQVIDHHQQRLAAAKVKLQPLSTEVKVLLLAFAGLNNIEIFGPQTYPGGLLQDLGIELVLPAQFQAGESYSGVSLEVLPELKANQIIVMASGQNTISTAKAQWQQNAILRLLPASRANQVYFVDYQLWGRIRGPIAAELVLEQICQMFFPEQNMGKELKSAARR